MKPRVYVETSVFSYLTARPTRDVVAAARQTLTREWWADAADRYELLVSQLVRSEAASGDVEAAESRLQVIDGLASIEVSDAAEALAQALVGGGAVPQVAESDAVHVALAVVAEVDYLLTWNFRHIANAHLQSKIETVCEANGYNPVTICTPETLTDPSHDD